MRRSIVALIACLTVLIVFSVAVAWEFLLEDAVLGALWPEQEPESVAERWEFVIMAGVAAVIAVLIMTPIALRIASRQTRTSEDLAQSERRLQQATRLVKLGHYVWDAIEDRCLYCSPEHARIHGLSVEDYIANASTLDGPFAMVHPEDRAEVQALFRALREGQEFELEYRVVTPTGQVRHIREMTRPEFDETGRVFREYGTVQDITALKEAEEKLVQSQKMEAVGQLTGGIAHDYNNALGVILGNLELARDMAEGGPIAECIDAAMRAADRSALLTGQLLAFSRKQALSPRPTDAGTLVSGMTDLLQRSLGEAIEIEVVNSAGLWTCMIDPHQLESALLNLAINARDAMPLGGKLTIETCNARLDDDYAAAQIEVEPGRYVLIAVTDTGVGMSSDVVEKAFEPFFTTKEVGKGSGLGLSMVHGFVKQSGGHVTIYSEEGKGTTAKLYLPRIEEGSEAEDELATVEGAPQGQGELVLIVEDDTDLRTMLVNMLQDLGYEVLEAGTGQSGLEQLSTVQNIGLLLTDVILPQGMTGRDLAGEAERRHPGLPVIYMSGYTEDSIIHHGRLDKGVTLLQKPFRKKDVARTLRRVLGPAKASPKPLVMPAQFSGRG